MTEIQINRFKRKLEAKHSELQRFLRRAEREAQSLDDDSTLDNGAPAAPTSPAITPAASAMLSRCSVRITTGCSLS